MGNMTVENCFTIICEVGVKMCAKPKFAVVEEHFRIERSGLCFRKDGRDDVKFLLSYIHRWHTLRVVSFSFFLLLLGMRSAVRIDIVTTISNISM